MSVKLLSEKYKNELYGVLHCYDRILINGHLHPLTYAKGMTKYLYEQDTGTWAEFFERYGGYCSISGQ